MARSVTDAALLLSAIAGSDPEDPITGDARPREIEDYTKYLDRRALAGARIGVPRKGWFGVTRHVDTIMAAVLDSLRALGAELIDNVELEIPPALDAAETTVLLYEIRWAMDAYLERRGDPRLRTLFDLMIFDLQHRERELRIFGHELFEKAVVAGLAAADYREARETCLAIARDKALDAAIQKHELDALVVGTGGLPPLIDPIAGDAFPSGPNSTTLPAVAGYPHITVPAGWYHGLPVGMSLIGAPFSEGKLLGYAFAFEQATRHRKPPRYLSTAPV